MTAETMRDNSSAGETNIRLCFLRIVFALDTVDVSIDLFAGLAVLYYGATSLTLFTF